MRVEAFVPDWPGVKQHAAEIANQVARIYPTRILDNPNDYFNAQWERARSLFTGDILLWAMADITLPERFPEMCQEMERVMETGEVGWYAPDVAWTGFIFDKSDLKPFNPGTDIYEVPNTDSVLFAIRGDVVRAMPYIDPEISFMWGMDFAAIVTAHLMGLKTVRDYKFKAGHPNDTGYEIDRASREFGKLNDSYEPKFREEMEKWIAWTNRLKRRP